MRKCRVCGLEAHSEAELDHFILDKRGLHGRKNLCKKCNNERSRKRKRNNDRVYLLNKLQSIKNRCYNPKDSSYKDYGYRGITICQEWLQNHNAFVEWALENNWKRGLTIERIDNDGSYNPENCRWIPRILQLRNTTRTTTNYNKGTRICNRCKEEKILEDFYRNRRDSTGRGHTCKDCLKIGD